MNTPDNNELLGVLKTLSVLYVEDEDSVREELARFLRRRFALVETAANGREGLDKFTQGHYDIVVTDVRMPAMDGLEMARHIKALANDVPVIVVTAYNEADYFMRAIEIGVDCYVKKPIDPQELIAAIFKSTRVHFQKQALEKEHERVLELMQQTVAALARAIEKRDPYTDGHQKRVSQLAVAIAEEMGMTKAMINGIRLAAMVHDIGKIHVPAEILSRPGRLTPSEFALIQQHPQSGFEIVGDIDFPWPIGQIILQHHERLDGAGYPNGLKGEDILVEASVIGVADVVDAMATDRPYRAALGIEAALEEIRDKRGKLFDPLIVDACVRVIEKAGRDFWKG
ncbi:hypothetical protein SKTS_17100 [Sulfurimicrobium lacus]|uniref:Two-component system response regulator n=1 Tax=Sulfurimicrobium lacus TaxID=2715678 RepID=A0A6F8VAY7_9PROT|nr:HD domain-containing phosphohydrolase [Sulfurimicrobium lacus]BCB26824.1 hypothetical protein SKTS_17100 [Sulfurimicrobium lacus]